MDLGDIISPDRVIPSLKARNKKHVLQDLALRASAVPGVDHSDAEIFEALLQRERLGSTGLGKGIALPHGQLSAVKQIVAIFARLEDPIDFEAIDGEPVDLVFLLLAPDLAGADRLKAMARISRLLREPLTIDKLRSSKKRAALYSILTEPLATTAV